MTVGLAADRSLLVSNSAVAPRTGVPTTRRPVVMVRVMVRGIDKLLAAESSRIRASRTTANGWDKREG
jgi:hypothetical protein